MAGITEGQVTAIHTALTKRGISDDAYRDILHEGFRGAKSCKELSRAQANDLLDMLNRGAGKRRRKPIRKPAAAPAPESGAPRLSSAAQRKLILDLVGEIRWHGEGGYDAWRVKSLGVRRVRTAAEAARVINGLKGLKRHGGRRE